MRLLYDQNLSYKLVDRPSDIFPDSSHVKHHDLSKEDDIAVRKFATENGFTIVTQDSDFYDLAMIYGIPPQIVWINRAILLQRISKNYSETTQFLSRILFKAKTSCVSSYFNTTTVIPSPPLSTCSSVTEATSLYRFK